MRPTVNLLPESYRQTRRYNRRVRLGITLGVMFVAVELAGGLTLHARAGRTRDALDDAKSARIGLKLIEAELDAPTITAEQIAQQLKLAKELRTKHRWSRLLTLLSNAIPERVVLTTIATDPKQWTSSQAAHFGNVSRTSASNKDMKHTGKKVGDKPEDIGSVVRLDGITVHGYAADYQDLSAFIGQLKASHAFAWVNLEEARRDKYLGQETIAFELLCHW